MFAVCHLWPRNNTITYQQPVYIILQKLGSTMDMYNSTTMLEKVKTRWKNKYIAIFLCLRGNDFFNTNV